MGIFERNAKKSVIVVIIVIVMMIDVAAAKFYEYFHGQPWYVTMFMDERNKYFKELQRTERSYRIPSDIYHHELKKNISLDDAILGSKRYRVATDSLGFKSRSVKNTPLVSDKYRIVFIGDSFTEGVGVNYEDTFVGIIADSLSKQNIDVLNAGVATYSPIIYWRKMKYLIEEAGLKLDEMIVFIDISDINDEVICYALGENNHVTYRSEAECLFKPAEDLENNNEEVKKERERKKDDGRNIDIEQNGLKGLIRNHSILMYSVMNKMHDYIFKKQEHPLLMYFPKYAVNMKRSMWTLDDKVFQMYGKEGLKNAERYMKMLVDLLKEHNIKLTIAVYPWPDQIVNKDLNSIQVSFWEKFANNNNAGFINLFPCFINLNDPKPYEILDKYFQERDMHWNERGHEVIANAFLRYYKDIDNNSPNYCMQIQ